MSAESQAELAKFPADWPDLEIVLVEAPFAPGGDYLMASCQLQSLASRGKLIHSSISS